MKKKVKELAKEEIIIKIPQKYKIQFPQSLSVNTIASRIVYGLNSPPPTEAICKAAAIRREILNKFGSQEPTYQRRIIIIQNHNHHRLMIKVKPDTIDRTQTKPIIMGLQTFSISSPQSKQNSIAIGTIKLSIITLLLDIEQGKIMLFGIEKQLKDNTFLIASTEYYSKTIFSDKKLFDQIIIAALRIGQEKRKRDQKVKQIQTQLWKRVSLIK